MFRASNAQVKHLPPPALSHTEGGRQHAAGRSYQRIRSNRVPVNSALRSLSHVQQPTLETSAVQCASVGTQIGESAPDSARMRWGTDAPRKGIRLMRGHAAALSVISALDRKRLTAGACPCCKRIAEALRSHT